MSKKSDGMTTIRVSKQTSELVNDIRRMLALATGEDVTSDDVVYKAALLAFGDQLDKSREQIRSIVDKDEENGE
jgi:hypothetical protein